jgi:uncharacterized protein YjeT (DUF2065 family)
MAEEGGVEMLVRLLAEPSDTVQRQAAKALANLGVHKDNKLRISSKGAVPPLIGLVVEGAVSVQIEAIAALANLAVNGESRLRGVRRHLAMCHLSDNVRSGNLRSVGSWAMTVRVLLAVLLRRHERGDHRREWRHRANREACDRGGGWHA